MKPWNGVGGGGGAYWASTVWEAANTRVPAVSETVSFEFISGFSDFF
jgi:hypothetical protein